MFCKFCGGQINRKTMRCVDCDRPVGPLEGGVGFWDLAGEKPKGGRQDPLPPRESRSEGFLRQIVFWLGRLGKRVPVLTMLTAGILIFAVMQSVFLMGLLNGQKRAGEALDDISGKLGNGSPVIGETTEVSMDPLKSPDPYPGYSMTFFPEPRNVVKGQDGTISADLFSLEVKNGELDTIQWEKLEDIGDYYDVDSEPYSFAKESGSEGLYILRITEPADQAGGKYQYTIKLNWTGNGYTVSSMILSGEIDIPKGIETAQSGGESE